MAKNWNKEGFFSGITEDYTNYRWYKGENENPYLNNEQRPLASAFWRYERDFHFSYLNAMDNSIQLEKAYLEWKERLLKEHLPGKVPNPYGDTVNWEEVFGTGNF